MQSALDEIYDRTIRPLPPADRLRLATRILSDIKPDCIVDDRQEWSEDDYSDFSAASWRVIAAGLEEEEVGQSG